MKNKKEYFFGLFTGLLIAAFLVTCVVCGKVLYDAAHSEEKNRSDAAKDVIAEVEEAEASGDGVVISEDSGYVLADEEVINKILLLEDTIDLYFINSVTDEEIEEGIYDGIMSSLNDPYAAYYSPEELLELQSSTEGVYYGIGAYLMLNQTTMYPQITGIIDNTSADDSELRIDDYIYMVDGVDVYGMELSDVVSMIKGEEGTYVDLTIVRPSTGEEIEMSVERRRVETPTVTYEMLENNIGYIAISEFDAVTVDQFSEALATVNGSDMEGLILDLRGNPGGSLSAVVDIADMILPEGLVVYTEDKYGDRTEYTSDEKSGLSVPMIVLVNGGSASASEILAGAIKDYGVGTLLGTTTYGKGIVQRIITLEDGSALKLTVSHYYTPLGNDIHEIGIEPDVVLEFDTDAYLEDEENDNQLEEAIRILTEEINAN